MAKRLDIRSSSASPRPAIWDAARSRAESIWFCLRSITARAAVLERKVKDWLATKGKRADRSPFQRPGRVTAGYSFTPKMPAKRASAASRISRASRPKMTLAE